jgi:hypothetical protein
VEAAGGAVDHEQAARQRLVHTREQLDCLQGLQGVEEGVSEQG